MIGSASYHITAFILIIFTTSHCLTGCGGEGEMDDGKTTIRISHWWGDSEPVWEEVITEFERAHPDINVEQQVMSFNLHTQRLQTAAAAGADVGDLVLMEDWFAQELLERDFLIDMEQYVTRDLPPEDYFPVSLNSFRHNGKLKAFPVALGSSPLFYNMELFDAAGLSYPDTTWTYDTLLAAAQRLTKDTDGDGKVDQWGFYMDNGTGFDAVLHSLGGSVLTDDGSRSAFAEPGTIRALQYWVDLVRKYKVSPRSASMLGGTSAGGSMRPFETGKFGMGIMSSFLTTYRNAQFDWNIALPPKGPAGRKALRFAAAFGIPRSSSNPEAAWRFLEWIVKKMPAKYSGTIFFGLVPNSTRLASSAEYLQAEPKVDREVLVELVKSYSFAYWRTGWFEFRDQGFLPELDLMVAGEKSVEEGAMAADRRINEVIVE